jgi:hypothetical protein
LKIAARRRTGWPAASKETGGTPECEDAVVKALDWLKATQSADGSWTGSNQAAMTGLALLAYLGHCETPLSKDYGDTVLRAITYLVNLGMKTGGKLSVNPADKHWPYEHAIATYALAEAATFCKQLNINVPNLLRSHPACRPVHHRQPTLEVRRLGLRLLRFRQPRRRPFIAAWHIQALKACQHTGLEFKGLNRAANKRHRLCQLAALQGRRLRLLPRQREPARRRLPHHDRCRPAVPPDVRTRARSPPPARGEIHRGKQQVRLQDEYADLYGHYYEAQAMMNRGGEQWKWYNDMFRDQLLKNQNTDGSWPPPGGKDGMRAVAPQFVSNVHYRTCLNTLMLEVYYRFLPGTGAGMKPTLPCSRSRNGQPIWRPQTNGPDGPER